jgi:phosphoserine phosphatase
MEKINAIDLDKTLIPFDSFRTLILSYLKQKSFVTPVTFHTVLRRIRLIESGEFKNRALRIISQDRHYQDMMQDLAGRLLSAVRPDVMKIIDKETDPETTNVLISASPVDYVKLVAKELGWPYLASEIIKNEFIHCHGQKKRDMVLIHYPRQKYEYNFAISDSPSDLPLLQMFKKYRLLN